ncbi:hypothetical protein F7725_002998, partial [Dissostichus mawsoni]
MTETMVAYLFEDSFKKQAKFLQFARQLKEPEPTTTLTFEILPNDCLSPTWQVQEYGSFPAVFTLPTFPKDIQTKLDAKQPCHKVSTDRHKIVRILHETMAQYTMYPTNSEYIKVAKALIFRYPFLKDMEGNGYNTWHMSLKRRFKAERTPSSCLSFVSICLVYLQDIISVSGEDESSIDAHTQAQPDSCIVTNAMTKTFQWRRKEVAEGVRADTIANKYPFLKTPAGLCEEMNRIHNIENLQQRFREEFLPILPKEKVEHHVTLEEPGTPYPTTQLTHTDWKSAFTSRGPSVVKTDGFELCRASDLEEGVLAAFCAYFVFNMAYPPNRKNTLTFVQRCILKISKEGDKPFST